MIRRDDGTGREPREKQLEILDWLESNWDKNRVKVIRAATGVGKSYIARALQLTFPGTVVMTSSNHLITQNLDTYPEANFVIGSKYYDCPESFQKARQALFRGESTFVNPISLDRFKSKNRTFQRPYLMVVDEFHVVARMLHLLVGTNLSRERYGQAPSPENDFAIGEWFETTMARLEKTANLQPRWQDKQDQFEILHRMQKCYKWWRKYPSQYLPENTNTGLKIAPIEIPKYIAKSLFDCEHLVLMSATPDVDATSSITGGASYIFKDFGAIIPVEQRPIYFDPIAEKVNRDTPPQIVAEWIKRQVLRHDEDNVIIHVPYSWQKKLVPYLPGYLFNTPQTKGTVLATFKKNGGKWLASGCSEGIDLPDDECRLSLIPILWKPDWGSKMIQKRIARKGQKNIDREVILTFQQQCGRGVRSADDHCTMVVGDPAVARLINRYRSEIPEDFINSFIWRT